MKSLTYLLLILAGSLILNGCSKTENNAVTPPPDNRLSFEREIWDYSTNHYFVDSVYADTSAALNIYSKFYATSTPQIVPEYVITKIEVWKSTTITVPDPKERIANAYISLYSRGPNDGLYPAAFREEMSSPTAGEMETGRFVLLAEGSDYMLDNYTGEISFKTPIHEDDAIAVAYRRRGMNELYGEFTKELPDTSLPVTIVLKLVKPKWLIPQYKKAWQLQLKNIYPIKDNNILKEGFEFNILALQGGSFKTEIQTSQGSRKLLSLFGFDKYDQALNPNPDGLFDFILDATIMPLEGEIRFPYLQPFGRQMPKAMPEEMRVNAIYDTMKVFARQMPVKYKLYGKYNKGY